MKGSGFLDFSNIYKKFDKERIADCKDWLKRKQKGGRRTGKKRKPQKQTGGRRTGKKRKTRKQTGGRRTGKKHKQTGKKHNTTKSSLQDIFS